MDTKKMIEYISEIGQHETAINELRKKLSAIISISTSSTTFNIVPEQYKKAKYGPGELSKHVLGLFKGKNKVTTKDIIKRTPQSTRLSVVFLLSKMTNRKILKRVDRGVYTLR